MTDRRRAFGAWALFVLVLAAAVAWWYPAHREAAPARPGQAAEAAAAPAIALDADGLPFKRDPPRARAPLPSRDAPLSTIALQLDALARQGDSRAACRLAVELLRCAEIESWTETMARERQDPIDLSWEDGGDVDYASKWADEEIWRIRQLEQCRLLPDAMRDQAWSRLREAALAGEPEAMIRYASSPQIGMGRGTGHGYLHHPGFDDWRREAPAMLQRLFRAGDQDAALLLMLTSLGDMDPLSGLAGGDRQTMLAYRLLMWRLRIDAPPPPPMPRHSALEIEQAMRQAEAWHRDHFGGRLYPRRTGYGKLAPLMMPNRDEPPPCE